MAEGPEKTVERIQTFVPVEKSISIDPHLEREPQKESRRRKRNSESLRTVQEQLEEEQQLRSGRSDAMDHIDYHA
ncbi:MAG: hypothetical protein LLF76_10840 [Planctomycetaceae bacterium]|nr:hypothetical protein [Planctomycetaceae bacterium]